MMIEYYSNDLALARDLLLRQLLQLTNSLIEANTSLEISEPSLKKIRAEIIKLRTYRSKTPSKQKRGVARENRRHRAR